MSVEIDPQELGFHRPFTVEVLENLKIRNPNTHPVAFKVKTTAPKQYCVRPNSGRVEPGKEVEVQVILQAMKQEPAPGTKCRDKFLVQSVAITSDKEFANLASIWDNIDKSSVQEKKIRVLFLDPKGSPHIDSAIVTPNKKPAFDATSATPEVAPPAYSSPSEYNGLQSEPKSSLDDESHFHEQSDFTAPTTQTTAKKNSVSREEPQQERPRRKSSVSQVSKKEDQSGLRQRKTAATEEKPITKAADITPQAVRTGTEGVPVQYVALLCLLSFLLAYFFF